MSHVLLYVERRVGADGAENKIGWKSDHRTSFLMQSVDMCGSV